MTDNLMAGSEFTTILPSAIIKIRYNSFHVIFIFIYIVTIYLKNLSSEISVLNFNIN